MKPSARIIMIAQLEKEQEKCDDDIIGVNFDYQTDSVVKWYYLRLQEIRANEIPYRVRLNGNFDEDLGNNKLNIVTFKMTSELCGLRRLTYVEYLKLIRFVDQNPDKYTLLEIRKFMYLV